MINGNFIFWSKISIIIIIFIVVLPISITNIMIMILKLNYTILSWTSTWSPWKPWSSTSWSWQRPMNLVRNVDQVWDLCVAQPKDIFIVVIDVIMIFLLKKSSPQTKIPDDLINICWSPKTVVPDDFLISFSSQSSFTINVRSLVWKGVE